MATDYDAPRTNSDEDQTEQSIRALQARRVDSGADLGDDLDPLDVQFDSSAADLSDDEAGVRVVPRQDDEFVCTRCYLIHHRSQLADTTRQICRDCAA